MDVELKLSTVFHFRGHRPLISLGENSFFLIQLVSSLHQLAKVLELQHQSF